MTSNSYSCKNPFHNDLGLDGLDYASSDRRYILRFLPGEEFTGLQLMCLMYVGYKQIQPDLEHGMVDTTMVRAHACTTGVAKNGTPAEQALGRSRGGFSTKSQVTVDGL